MSDILDKRLFTRWAPILAASFSNLVTARALLYEHGVPAKLRWYVWVSVAQVGASFKEGAYGPAKYNAVGNRRFSWAGSYSSMSFVDANSTSSRRPSTDSVAAADATDVVSEIRKDVQRTFPESKYFRDMENVRRLGDVLATFTTLHHTRFGGYSQGMNVLAAVLLQQANSEEDSYWMLHALMFHYGLQGLFINELPLVRLLTHTLMCVIDQQFKDVFQHLDRLQVSPELFAVKWFISLFALSASVKDTAELWDFLLAACPPLSLPAGMRRGILLLSVSIIKLQKREILNTHSAEDLVMVLNKAELHGPTIVATAREMSERVPEEALDYIRAKWAIKNEVCDELLRLHEVEAHLSKTTRTPTNH